jgi:hypothetical protein
MLKQVENIITKAFKELKIKYFIEFINQWVIFTTKNLLKTGKIMRVNDTLM